jgi:ribosomal protein S18 acetylase RimI-like enzyme
MNDQNKISKFVFREATFSDVTDLAKLHAATWKETYESIYPQNLNWPSAELRESQWRGLFKNSDESWFCYVTENDSSELVGFAMGKKYNHSDLPDFQGELNKIYLLRNYHCLGLGRKLFNYVAKKFLQQGIYSIVLFSDPQNPTGKFFEHLEAEKIYAKNGAFDGGYCWRDLKKLKLA